MCCIMGLIVMEDVKLDDYINIGGYVFKTYFPSMMDIIVDRGLWKDLQQTMYLIALEAVDAGYVLPDNIKDVSNLFYRELYAFLLSYGFVKRENGFISLEVFFDDIMNINKEGDDSI